MIARRLWWATLPYWGWTTVTPDEVADGARPCPWYAWPLAWLHRTVQRWLIFRNRDWFGPRYSAWERRYPERAPKPWS